MPGQRPQRAARVQPAVHPLVLPGRRLPGLHRRRGAQHLRGAARLPAAPDDAGRRDGEGLLRLAVQHRRRPVPDAVHRPGRAAARDDGAAGRRPHAVRGHPAGAGTGRGHRRRRPYDPPLAAHACGWPRSSGGRASGCGRAGCRSSRDRHTILRRGSLRNTPRRSSRTRSRTGHDHGAPQPERSEDTASPVPRPDEAHWPGLATAPRSPCASRRRAAVPARGVHPAGAGGPARRHRARAGGPGRRGCAWSTRERLPPPGCRRQDRLRRGLHDRRLDDRAGHRPGRPAHPVRGPDVLAGPPGVPAAAPPGRAHPADGEENTKENSRHNISRHYDLSNQLFEASSTRR